MLKALKNIVRKVLINPFGYDLVPMYRGASNARAPQVAKRGEQDLKPYVRWFGAEAVRQRRFYNVGAEDLFQHPAWTRVNHPSEHYGSGHIDIQWDLMADSPLPVEDSAAKVIFSRYTLEHVPDAAAQHFFSEAYRALAKDGWLRVIVPDIELYYAAYLLKDAAFFYRPKHDRKTFPNAVFITNINGASFEQKFLWSFASSASTLHADGAAERIMDADFQRIIGGMSLVDALDYCTAKCSLEVQRRHPENHINWYSASKLAAMMKKAGFDQAYRSGFGQSHCPVLRDTQLLEARKPEVGLYMEARK